MVIVVHICDWLCKNQLRTYVCTKSKIHSIAQDYSYTQEVSITVSLLPNVLFWRASRQPCDVMVKRMVAIEGTNWVAMSHHPLPLCAGFPRAGHIYYV